MIDETTRRLLLDARQQVADARSEIGQAVVALEEVDGEQRLMIEALLAEAANRLSILDGEIGRFMQVHGVGRRAQGGG